MVGVRGIGAKGVALVCALGLAGCQSRSFGPGYTPGLAVLPLDLMARQNIAGCGAEGFAGLRGQPFTALAGVPLRGQLRVLRPGQGLTRDLVADRLNVQVDPEGRVLQIFCG